MGQTIIILFAIALFSLMILRRQSLISCDISNLYKAFSLLINQNRIIMTNTEQALADIAEVKSTMVKIGTETSTLLQKITDLQNTAPSDTPQVVLDGLADLKTQTKVIDDLVPDVPAA